MPDMFVYDFGKKEIWPKPELSTPYQVLDHYSSLVRRLQSLGEVINVSSGRSDHMVRSLDTTAFALREALFQVMVLRETLTGFPTKEGERESAK